MPKDPSSPRAGIRHIQCLSLTGDVCSLSREAVNRITVVHYRQKWNCQVSFAYIDFVAESNTKEINFAGQIIFLALG